MSNMFAPNFEAIRRVTLVLEPKNLPTSVAQKAVSVKNGLTPKKIFDMVVCLKIPLHPDQPTFGHDEVFSLFFFLFFLPNFCTLFFS